MVVPILVLSSDLEDSNDLAFTPLRPVGADVIAHYYSKGCDSDTSSGEVNMAPKFRTLGQKKSHAVANLPAVLDPPIVQDLP